MTASIFVSLQGGGAVFILATLLSFMAKLVGTDGGGISRVWDLFPGNGCTILGGHVRGSTGISCSASFMFFCKVSVTL